MKRLTKSELNEIYEMVKGENSVDQIATKLNENGKTTPNGMRWTMANVSYYTSKYKMYSRARKENNIFQINEKPIQQKESLDQTEKIKLILNLGLSKSTTINALTEILK